MFKAVNHLRQADKQYRIYALNDPKDKSTRYIGYNYSGLLAVSGDLLIQEEEICRGTENNHA
jgi:hypothetical protein